MLRLKHALPLLAAVASGTIAVPAFAQHNGHTPTSTEPARGTVVPEAQADPHAGHDMGDMPGMEMDADPHAGHDMAPVGTNLPAGTGSPPPIPTDHAADAVFGAAAMGMARHHLDQHGAQKISKIMVDSAEVQLRRGHDSFEWSGEGWYGGDIDKLWIKTEGEVQLGGPLESAEVQALYSHAIGPYFNLQGGVRHDFRPDPSRTYAVATIEGLAPGMFEVEGSAFVSTEGELAFRLEGNYDQRVTQRLILQPSVELDFSAQDIPELRVGSGLTDAEVGLRLRYEIRREFAPYIGALWTQTFGGTRRYARAAGDDAGSWRFVTGIRAWF